MARLIKNTRFINIVVAMTTIFTNGTQSVKLLKNGDVVENLRYVKDEEIAVVSGRIINIGYTMNRNLTWNKKNPQNTLIKDMVLTDITLDVSEKYNAMTVDVPVREIVEFEGDTDVDRIDIQYFIVCNMEMHYSDYRVENVSVQVGDIFDNVHIIYPQTPGKEFKGQCEVVGFDYNVASGLVKVNGIAFKTDTGEFIVAAFDQILSLNELYNYEIDSEEAIAEVLANIADGDTISVSHEIDTTNKAITINKERVNLVLNKDIVTDGSKDSGIRIANGSVTISGDSIIVNNTSYDSSHGSGVIGVDENGTLVFNGSGISAVIDDPVNNGQFGVCLYSNAKVTVNDGKFNTGWYCISGNGAKTNADSIVEINGGEFISVADYAIYHPQPGTLIINGGVIKGAAGAVAVNGGHVVINGGDFSVLGGGDTGEWQDGTSGLGNAALNLNAKYTDVTCIINGGRFSALSNDAIMIATGSAHIVDLKIYGGEFSTKPKDEWIPEGYAVSEEPSENGFYTVDAIIEG